MLAFYTKEEVLEQRDREDHGLRLVEAEEEPRFFHSALAGHVISKFNENKMARQYAGVNDQILESLYAFNGEYTQHERSIIEDEGGSDVFMNLTAIKCRALMSWIRDIYSGVKKPWTLRPTPIPELPDHILQLLQQDTLQRLRQLGTAPDMEGKPISYRKIKELERAAIDAYLEEARIEADYNFKLVERKVEDQLKEGGFDQALSDFIEHFAIYPTAFLKGPVVGSQSKLVWSNGQPLVSEEYVLKNYVVNPLDIYPSPSAKCIDDGNFIEHLRLTESQVASLIGVRGYNDSKLREAIEIGENYAWYDEYIETERALTEAKGDQRKANIGMIHGLHFFGTAPRQLLLDWGLSEHEIPATEVVEIEAVLLGNEVVKACVNKDPLRRRPYMYASFQRRPGSIWGRSLPNLMRDIQRICNSCARALMNNMALSSGPQAMINIDRLADDSEIEELFPRKIWQTTADPMGNQGRPIDFFVVPSVANDLLGVYERFAIQADDATGIPRYAHGNERAGGAAQTARGLSLMLETTTKSVKDAIRHIDEALESRLRHEFYMVLLRNPDLNFTGDIEVEALASRALTLRAAEQQARMEFMQITANPVDQQMMGIPGRLSLLRELGKDLGFTDPIVPNALEAKEMEKALQQRETAEQQAPAKGLEATQMQVEAQMAMNQRTQETKQLQIQQRQSEHQDKMFLEQQRLEQERQKEASRMAVAVDNKNKDIAVELKKL